MPSSHPTTIIVAVSSSVLPSKQWDIVKTQLYQCWIQLYGPLFWIVSAMLCFWDSKTTAPYHRITVMEMPPSTTTTTTTTTSRHITAATRENINESMDHENNKTNTIAYMSQSDGSNKQHKKSLKRIIKNHIQTIKQRRQSLNEAVKRSVRRRPSQQHNNNNNRNGLASELHPPTATTHSMPPPRRHSFPGTANMLLKPFRRKTAPAIFNNQK